VLTVNCPSCMRLMIPFLGIAAMLDAVAPIEFVLVGQNGHQHDDVMRKMDSL
jgi:hypothetical protein